MRAVHIRRLLGAGALVAAFGLATLAPAGAQEEAEGEESTELDHAVEECIHELEEANSIDVNCQQAPNPLLPETNEIIWGTFGFLIVFAFLAWKGIPAIRGTMDARTERIRGDLEGAESAKAEAQSVLDEYRAQLADAKAEAGRIIEEARSAADDVRRDQAARLQTELAEMRERAGADVEAAKAQAIADLRGEVATLAIGAAEIVVGRNLDHDTQAQLVEQYIASVQNRN
jgi:F-type H+-transporting ATPase subunit b